MIFNHYVIIVIYRKDKYVKMKKNIINYILQKIYYILKYMILNFLVRKNYLIFKIKIVKKILIGMIQLNFIKNYIII